MREFPKVVVIGAGSLFFGREVIWQMTHSEHLRNGCLALVDTDAERLDKMGRLAELVAAQTGAPLQIEVHANWKDALPGADFVVLSFAVDTVRYRGIDCDISAKYGVRMCSGDTIGPGGILRAMRDLPAVLDCAADVASLCPDAWLINYINPSAVNGIALAKFAPAVKSFALCDSLHMPHIKIRQALLAGIIDEASQWTAELDDVFDLAIAGVNHFTWLLHARYAGRDVTPQIVDSLRKRRMVVAVQKPCTMTKSPASFTKSSAASLPASRTQKNMCASIRGMASCRARFRRSKYGKPSRAMYAMPICGARLTRR